MIFDQANAYYVNSGTISDGATIAASGFQLTNSVSGRIYGVVTFSATGSSLINELGGVIALSQFESTSSVIVFGSDGADTIINGGLIKGAVALGGGADIYIDRDGFANGVDLGLGDDTYRVENAQPLFLGFTAGGAGQDRVIMAGTANQYWGDHLSGFEQLVLETGGNFENFSGFQSITITGPPPPTAFFNLIDSLNPAVDLNVAGHWLMLHGSSLRSVVGGDDADWVWLGFDNQLANGISLGGGDDRLTLNSYSDARALPIDFTAQGGDGSDTLILSWATGGDRSYDLSPVQGFEKLDVNAWAITAPATARLSHLSGFTDIDAGQNVTLIVSDSDLAHTRIGGGLGGGLTIEGGVSISRYGFPEDGTWDNRLDIVQGDPALSTAIVNHGSISGDVRFYTGDDFYDGRDGTVGGTIYGNAGNDTLWGGAGREIMVGGYGADVLTGGAGDDIFKDTAAGHNGDTIADFSRGDTIVITDATLAGFSFQLSGNLLTYTGGSLTLSHTAGAALLASAAAGGGVQIVFKAPPVVMSAGASLPSISQPSFDLAAVSLSSAKDALDLSDHHPIRPGHELLTDWADHTRTCIHPGFDWPAHDLFPS